MVLPSIADWVAAKVSCRVLGLGIIAAYSRSITRLHGLEKGAVLGLRCIIAQFEHLVAIGRVKGADEANFNRHGDFLSLGMGG